MFLRNNRIIGLAIFICFLFIFCSYVRADKVLLKNGNTLEGKIIKEDSDAVFLEVYMESGSSKTKISKSKIRSVEYSEILEPHRPKAPQPYRNVSARLSPKEIEVSVKKLRIVIIVMAGLFFTLLSLPFFILNLISKIKLEKPFGFKIICVWVSYASVLLSIVGVITINSGMKGVLTIGIPLCAFILLAGLVYLRWWGRILLIILLILGIATQAAELVLKKDLIGNIAEASWQKIAQKYHIENTSLIQGIEKLAQQNPLGPAAKWYMITFFVLMLLYLNRKQVSDAFAQASQYKLSQIIGKTRLIVTLLVIAILIFIVDKSYKPILMKLTRNQYFVVFQEALKAVAIKPVK